MCCVCRQFFSQRFCLHSQVMSQHVVCMLSCVMKSTFGIYIWCHEGTSEKYNDPSKFVIGYLILLKHLLVATRIKIILLTR